MVTGVMTPPDQPSSHWNTVDFSTDQALVAGLAGSLNMPKTHAISVG